MEYPNDTPRWRRYLRFWRRDVNADVDDELRFHFESRVEELVAQGMPGDGAQQRALEEFGDVDGVRRRLTSIDQRIAHSERRGELLGDLAADLRYAARSLGRSPGVTAAIVATLVLGLGGNATMFSLLETIYLRPPAGVVAPGSIRRLWRSYPNPKGATFAQWFSYPQAQGAIDALQGESRAAMYMAPRTMSAGSGDSRTDIKAGYAGPGFFELLGVRAARGRLFGADENDLAAPVDVAVLSDDYWRSAFGADSGVLGRTLALDGVQYTLIGILPRGFTGIDLDAGDVWLPYAAQPGDGGDVPWYRETHRLATSVLVRETRDDERSAAARLTAVVRRPDLSLGSADTAGVAAFGAINAARGPGNQSQEVQIALRLAGVALLLLLIACGNVINLMLARLARRRREIAVRVALGISRGRLLRLLLAETFLLAMVAAGITLIIGAWSGTAIRRLLLPGVHWAAAALDVRIITAVVGVALVAGIVVGLVPALRSATASLMDALRASAGDAAPHHTRLRSGLVAAQAALSVVLLVGALLFVRSLSNVRALDIGFQPERLVVASVNLPGPNDPSSGARLRQIEERAAGMRDVERAALASMGPMRGFSFMMYYTETDSMGAIPSHFPSVAGVSPGYFATVGTPFVRGSDFPHVSGAAMPAVAIVNEEMARRSWPGRDAIGQCMRFGKKNAECYRVIGIVGNAHRDAVIETPQPQYYLPLDHLPPASPLATNVILLRATPRAERQVVRDVQGLLRREFPGGMPRVQVMYDYLVPQYRPWRLGALLFSSFGALALIVAAIGMYGMVSYTVSQRTREFGVRIALGAGLGNILRIVIARGIGTVAIGVVIGIALTAVAGRLIASLLYGVTPRDPWAIGGVAMTLIGVAAFAALGPAVRAARVDPASALRAD